MRSVDLLGIHVETDDGVPFVVLRERDDPHRILPIAIGGTEAVAIAVAVQGTPTPRPLTHDLLASLVDELHGHLDRVELTEVREGTFLADLVLSGPTGELRLDARPSDALALAVRVDAPIFAGEDLLDEAGAVLEVEIEVDEESLEQELEAFRSFIEDVRPDDFVLPDDDVQD